MWLPVAIAALVQALLFFTFAQPEIAVDSASYMAQAESLVATGAALNARGEPDTVRTPGYPLFLAAFLSTNLGYPGAIVGQRILWVLLVLATTQACYRLTRDALAANVAGVIMAIDLPALQATNSILTETLAATLVSLTLWQTYRANRSERLGDALLAGVLAGATAWVRPVAILLAAALALALVIAGSRRFRYRAAVALVGTSLLVSGAWIARNYVQTGVVTFSTISSINLLLYRAAGTLAIRDPGGVDPNIQRRQRELEAVACAAAESQFGRPCDAVPITLRATLYDDIAMPIILGDPVATAMQAGRAFVMIMFGGGASMLAGLTGITESSARLMAFAYTVPLALLASVGWFYWWRLDRLAAMLMLFAIAYLVFMSLGTEAYSRFRVPFLPLYAMLAGGGAALSRRWSASRRPAQ